MEANNEPAKRIDCGVSPQVEHRRQSRRRKRMNGKKTEYQHSGHPANRRANRILERRFSQNNP